MQLASGMGEWASLQRAWIHSPIISLSFKKIRAHAFPCLVLSACSPQSPALSVGWVSQYNQCCTGRRGWGKPHRRRAVKCISGTEVRRSRRSISGQQLEAEPGLQARTGSTVMSTNCGREGDHPATPNPSKNSYVIAYPALSAFGVCILGHQDKLCFPRK